MPEDIVRRRYRAGRRNFFGLYRPLTTTWRVYDNSIDEPRLIASGAGVKMLQVNDMELWRRIEQEASNEG